MSIQARLTKLLLKLYFWHMHRQPYQQQRLTQEKFSHLSARIRKDIAFEMDSVGDVPVEWVSDLQSSQERVILYFHGGAYFAGSLITHREFAAQLAKVTGFRVLLVDYRLAPENPYPAAVEDAIAAYRWLLTQGFSPDQIIIAGDSAGGGLSLATLVNLRDLGDAMPAGAFCISPWTDLALEGDSLVSKARVDFICTPQMLRTSAPMYYGAHNPKSPLISPLYADLTGLPPLLIHVGTEETLLDDAIRLAEAAEEAGVEVDLHIWPEMFHVFPLAGYMPETQAAMGMIKSFSQHNCSGQAPGVERNIVEEAAG